MDLRNEVKSRLAQTNQLAKKCVDDGDVARASAEYLKCARLAEHLAGLSPAPQKTEILDRAKKFAEIAEGLKEGNIKVFTNGIRPATATRPEATVKSTEEKLMDKEKRLIMVEKPNIRFADIAGLDQVKENIKEAIIYPFKYPEEYQFYRVKPGGGMLMYGPPGCGKTMMAKAAAAECDVIFINLNVSDIKDKYVGESEKNIRDVFEIARSHERAIIFFDEVDAIAGERSASREKHEKDLVSELLIQMDGLNTKGAIRLVLAATNRPWDVDIALRRPPRFGEPIFIPHPDNAARHKLFEIELSEKPIAGDVNLPALSQQTAGYASAEIIEVCQRAAKIPLRERITRNKPRRQIAMADFEQVLAKYRPVLPAWYARAINELKTMTGEDTILFRDLIEAAKEFSFLK